MDALQILITCAAVVSVVAFVGIGYVLLRQGHQLRRLQEQLAGGGSAGGERPEMLRLRRLRAGTSAEGGDAAAAPRAASGGYRRPLLIGGLAVLVLALAAGGAWALFLRDDGSSTGGTQAATPPPPPVRTQPVSDAVPDNPPPLRNKADYTVAVLNASGVDGVAANKVGPRVQQEGYTVGTVDNAARDNVRVSMVMYPKGKRVVAQNVAHDLGIKKAPPIGPLAAGRTGGADAVVIVGRDIAAP